MKYRIFLITVHEVEASCEDEAFDKCNDSNVVDEFFDEIIEIEEDD